MEATSLPYREPSILQVLILSTFGFFLNLISWALERSIYCGLVGQILIGVFWGTPLGGWLDSSVEIAVVQLGYLGLILLVYEGGLSTSLAPLLSNLRLSAAVAITGIILPISLSFTLTFILPGTTPLQSFAAGAALSATSLGTTFSILTSSGFAKTRLGTVLTSAAMMDDVVGLVMIQIIAELGSGTIGGATVGRPVGASVGLLVGVVIMCRWVVGPFWRRFGGRGVVEQKEVGKVQKVIFRMDIGQGQMAFLLHTGVLLALISGASYAGTSVLFAAFLAGAVVSWWDKMIASSPSSASTSPAETQEVSPETVSPPSLPAEQSQPWTGTRVYEHYYATLAARILVPFFFASIGFSIPITQLFNGGIVWRGLVYALLMAAGKFVTGVWLLRFTVPEFILRPVERLRLVKKLGWRSATGPTPAISTVSDTRREPEPENNKQPPPPPQSQSQPQSRSPSSSPLPPTAPVADPPQKPRSLYPPAIIGLAMIARGEIGFLIASVAEAHGIFSSSASHSESTASSELYLIVVWATVLCTILGPVAVGLCVRRVKTLERERVLKGGSGDGVLGSWGVEGLRGGSG